MTDHDTPADRDKNGAKPPTGQDPDRRDPAMRSLTGTTGRKANASTKAKPPVYDAKFAKAAEAATARAVAIQAAKRAR
jgi:hypothetical protein